MDVLEYESLETTAIKASYQSVIEQIKQDDFSSVEMTRLQNTYYYCAKLDAKHKVLFAIIEYKQKKYALMLDVIHQNEHEKSRFLNQMTAIQESKILNEGYHFNDIIQTMRYINPNYKKIHILDKILSFDTEQEEIFNTPLPLILIGSAGSGKTMLTLEKIKQIQGDILYVTRSPYLVQNSRNLYYSNHYTNELQNIDFFSYQELIESILCPKGTEMTLRLFLAWLAQYHKGAMKEADALYEEFKGVITGSIVDKPYLSKEEYCRLGIKQSIFPIEERSRIYALFERYLAFLAKEQYYDINILSYDYLKLSRPTYDLVVIDEIQDLTNIQLYLILKTLNYPDQFILCGDSNQIVHPNFFSWAKIKTLFYQELMETREISRIIKKNYRNSYQITKLANKILKIKNARFGSIDRESNFLIEGSLENEGVLECIVTTDEILQEFNQKTKRSVKYAIIVMHEAMKEEVKRYFQTPLVFSIQEAKGLEYENVILYHFISGERKRYVDISEGVTPEDLMDKELNYSRAKDKSDRSLEIYKFYINALYVAVTRAIKNLYILEQSQEHPLINLLDMKHSEGKLSLEVEGSSLEEWRKEAHKLELQGKKEQADEIRSKILNYKPVPWQVITHEQLGLLCEKAFSQDNKSKEARITLFEYALVYQMMDLIEKLRSVQFKSANSLKNALEFLDRKYFAFYTSQNMINVLRQIDNYGIEFRNIFNQTSLMIASAVGNISLVQKLIENGANVQAVDNICRNALQIALNKAYFDKHYAKTKLSSLYDSLAASSLSIKVEDKLIKIDNRLMEFFILNLIIGVFLNKKSRDGEFYAFSTRDFMEPLMHFPEQVLPERRKKRSYISHILSKNEVNRPEKYNRQLFQRIAHGYYILNSNLEIKIEDRWLKLNYYLPCASDIVV